MRKRLGYPILKLPLPTKNVFLSAISLHWLRIHLKSVKWKSRFSYFQNFDFELTQIDILNSFGILEYWTFYYRQLKHFKCWTSSCNDLMGRSYLPEFHQVLKLWQDRSRLIVRGLVRVPMMWFIDLDHHFPKNKW